MTGQTTSYGYEPDRNLRAQVWNQFNGATVSQYDSGYNAAGQRTSVLNVGTAFAATAFNRFDYNDRSELKESSRYIGNNIYDITQPVHSEYRHYEYDPIGNRSGITEASNNGSYISNNLNQYTTETPPGGGSNTYVHDEDGNLTSISGNKNVTYTYNAENRLVSAQPTTPVAGDKKVELLYDYQGRRVQKIISSWNGSWTVDTTKHFVYDGWNVIQEITTAQPTKYYVWGLDLSQSLQGAGGVGGLLAMVSGLDSYTYMYDGNGNVGQMLNSSTGVIEAHYEYDPYGNETLATGALASSNPYRFSTKYLDDEFNLYYYGFRYYDPETGRWLNRDPIEEEGGGLNLYIFVGNNPINLIDILGLAEWKKEPSLQGPSFKSLGIMDPFEFWTIIPPSVGLGGEWFMISGSINGCAICDTCEEIDITLSLGKKVGIGIGLTFYPPLMYLRKGAKAFKGIKEAVKFYNNEWTQLAIDMGNSPDFWCTITPSIIEEAEAKYGNGDFEVSIRVEQKIIE